MSVDFSMGTATFVMAHWRNDNEESRFYLDQAVDGIFAQTDTNWQLVIVDDLSPCAEAREYLKEVKERCPEKIHVIFKDTNDGPGICRNVGIKWAYEKGSPFILFNDADDISHSERLETVRKEFLQNPQAAVVYSTFQVIDEKNNLVDEKYLTQSILEILEGHRENPVCGSDAWIQIGVEKGYTNLTSSTAVRTDVAYKYPFPAQIVSEDQHAWLRYSAGGGDYIYSPDIPSLYRIPQGTPTVSRARIMHYYEQKAAVDTDGFLEALRLAQESGKFSGDKDSLLVKFYVKLAETLGRENQNELAADQIAKAARISLEKTKDILKSKKLQNLIWAKL
ncbi:glycosyltransferase family A protein [Acetivibrio cellulolyticus]|uniref:glycosyltransferase family A protein n=1 Tax=Acetivibrio cellulolyticus TaxID=35830 RepID=UPI0001E2FAE6|nr:glycosyltransferase family A protein [Acetivibrio cellulolyticus]